MTQSRPSTEPELIQEHPGRANVLIVDDRPDNLLALEAALEPLGQNLIRAGSGDEALRILLKEEIAVIILSTPPPKAKEVSVAIDPGAVLLADAQAMDHVISNLLVNAYRYGGSEITLEARGDNGCMVLTVSDDGPGVAKELVPRLFEPFTRGKTASSMGGSGLGLALVKSLVEATGGGDLL